MSDTIQKYRDYVMTGFVKSVAPIVIEKASGAVVTDINGREYLDCFAGISVVNAGHCNPKVIAAAKAQMDKLIHCSSYLYHAQPVADLAEKIAHIAPRGLDQDILWQRWRRGHRGRAQAGAALHRKARVHRAADQLSRPLFGRAEHHRQHGTQETRRTLRHRRRLRPCALHLPLGVAERSGGMWPRSAPQAIEDIIRFATSGDVAAFIAEPVLGEGGIIVPPVNYFQGSQKSPRPVRHFVYRG